MAALTALTQAGDTITRDIQKTVQWGLQKTLPEMISGMRRSKANETAYISECIKEIRDEVVSSDYRMKAYAVQKLIYLCMIGYDISWASFRVVEVMSSPKFTTRRLGYQCASISFADDTDVSMLTTQLIRKDFSDQNVYVAGMALNCLANMATTDLARDLAADVVAILNTSRPYVRKRAVLVLFRIFLRFPDALPHAFPRLKDKLEDTDQAVSSAAVSVICELARRQPKNYLSLAPLLFKLLTTSTNNWMLIKIIKLFAVLTPLEPRLPKKLVEPLTNIINTTSAMSLLYEAINTCSIGLTEFPAVIRLCLTKLRTFVEDPDPNLKYLGLVALGRIMVAHPRAVVEHRDMILNCLDDEDITVRTRALGLLDGMVNKKSLPEITKRLLALLRKADGPYRDLLTKKAIELCSSNTYANLSDFDWYLAVLVELAHVPGDCGALIAAQLMDVVIRVKVIRPSGVAHAEALLHDRELMVDSPGVDSRCEVIGAAAWLVAEFADHCRDPVTTVRALLQPACTSLPGHIKSMVLHNVLKLLAAVAARSPAANAADATSSLAPAVQQIVDILTERLPAFTHSPEVEAQERACFGLALVELVRTDSAALAAMSVLFADPLNPVRFDAQQHVPVPDDLDLDAQINAPLEPEKRDDDFSDWGYGYPGDRAGSSSATTTTTTATFGSDYGAALPRAGSASELSPEERERQRQARLRRMQSDPFYIAPDASPRAGSSTAAGHGFDDLPPVLPLNPTELGLATAGGAIVVRRPAAPKVVSPADIMVDEEAPTGLVRAPSGANARKAAASAAGLAPVMDQFDAALRNVDLTTNAGSAVAALPVRTHRVVAAHQPPAAKPSGGGKLLRKKPAAAKPAAPGSKPAAALLDLGVGTDIATAKPLVAAPMAAPGKKPRAKKPAAAAAAAAAAPAAASAPAAVSGVPSPVMPLCADNAVRVAYELKVSPAKPTDVLVELRVTALHGALSGLTFRLQPPSAAVQPLMVPQPLLIKAGEQVLARMLLRFEAVGSIPTVPGQLTYVGGGVSTPHRLAFQLVFPPSHFVLPLQCTPEQFAQVSATALVSASSTVPCADLRSGLMRVAGLLHLHLVEAGASGATLYGRSVQSDHVAVTVRPGAGALAVDIRTPRQALSDGLLAEVQRLFS